MAEEAFTQTSIGVSNAVTSFSVSIIKQSSLIPGSLYMLTPEESFGMYSFNLKSIVNPTSSSVCFQAKLRASGQYQV